MRILATLKTRFMKCTDQDSKEDHYKSRLIDKLFFNAKWAKNSQPRPSQGRDRSPVKSSRDRSPRKASRDRSPRKASKSPRRDSRSPRRDEHGDEKMKTEVTNGRD